VERVENMGHLNILVKVIRIGTLTEKIVKQQEHKRSPVMGPNKKKSVVKM